MNNLDNLLIYINILKIKSIKIIKLFINIKFKNKIKVVIYYILIIKMAYNIKIKTLILK